MMQAPMAARYLYAGLFLLASFLACLARETQVTFFQRQRISGCQGNRDCLQAEAVLLISMISFLFFFVMSLLTMFSSKLEDLSSTWHSQCWLPKCLFLFLGAFLICVLAPTYSVQLYGNIAAVGAGMFISIQLTSVIRYITRLNYNWCQTNFEQRYAAVILVSFVAYSASTAGAMFMIAWYTDSWFKFNAVFICTTLLLVYLMALIALKSKANGRYMEPGLVGVYIMFLCWSAIRSEPETSGYRKEKASSDEKWKTMISFVFGLISMVVAAFSTGSNYKCIWFGNTVESGDDIPYGYGYFHFVLAMGSMYFGMVFVGWDTHHITGKWNMDVGWMCTWVHIVNEALVVISFVAILLARTNGIGWLRQLLARMFGIGGQQQGGDQSQTMEQEMDAGP